MCKIWLPDYGWRGGERYCAKCLPRGSYRVHMNFFLAGGGWVVQFSPPSLDRAIGPIRRWANADAIRELIGRTPTKMDSEAKQMLELAIEKGRGGLFLDLTPEQFASLHLPAKGRIHGV